MSEETLLEEGAGEGKLVRRLILFVVFVNLVATTAGGYFLVGRYEAKLYETGTELAKYQSNLVLVESEIKKLELAQTELKSKYEAQNERLSYSLDMVRLLNEARPKMRVRIEPNGVKEYSNIIEVTYLYENVGKYDILPKMQRFSLSDDITGKAISLKDVKFDGGLTIPAGSSIWLSVSFSKKGLSPKRVYKYSLKYSGNLPNEMGDFIQTVIHSGGHKIPSGFLTEVGNITGTISY